MILLIRTNNSVQKYTFTSCLTEQAAKTYIMSVVSQEIVNYIFQAFPNASTIVQEIITKYARELMETFAVGLAALWEFVYDRLAERNLESISVTAASENITEASAPESSNSRESGAPPNGYNAADKSALEKILDNTEKEAKKNQMQQYKKRVHLKMPLQILKNSLVIYKTRDRMS
jgi:hypothetical protein